MPHQLEDSELVAFHVSMVNETLLDQGYELSSPYGLTKVEDLDVVALARLSMLVACDSVWFPKDFERSAMSVGEYNYAYALRKHIVVDKTRRLLD